MRCTRTMYHAIDQRFVRGYQLHRSDEMSIAIIRRDQSQLLYKKLLQQQINAMAIAREAKANDDNTKYLKYKRLAAKYKEASKNAKLQYESAQKNYDQKHYKVHG